MNAGKFSITVSPVWALAQPHGDLSHTFFSPQRSDEPVSQIERGIYVTPEFRPDDGSDPYQIEVTLLPEAWKQAAWGKWGLDIRTSDWNGEANTKAILEADPNNELARFLFELEVNGRRGYYWGSRREIDHVYSSMGRLVRAFLPNVSVWSSTQCSADDAWLQYFGYGYVYGWSKSCKASVLALRRFSN